MSSPVEALMVAAAVLALVHVPLVVMSERLVVDPVHTLVLPLMLAGAWLTLTVKVVLVPHPVLNVIMVVP